MIDGRNADNVIPLSEAPERLRSVLRFAETLFASDREVEPRLFIWVKRHPACGVIPVGKWMNEVTKVYIENLMIQAARRGATDIGLLSESWMVAANSQEEIERAQQQSIDKHPGRFECLHVAFESGDFQYLAYAKILREPARLDGWEVLKMSSEQMRADSARFNLPMPLFQNTFWKANQHG